MISSLKFCPVIIYHIWSATFYIISIVLMPKHLQMFYTSTIQAVNSIVSLLLICHVLTMPIVDHTYGTI